MCTHGYLCYLWTVIQCLFLRLVQLWPVGTFSWPLAPLVFLRQAWPPSFCTAGCSRFISGILCPFLESLICPRTTGSFHWRKVWKTKIWGLVRLLLLGCRLLNIICFSPMLSAFKFFFLGLLCSAILLLVSRCNFFVVKWFYFLPFFPFFSPIFPSCVIVILLPVSVEFCFSSVLESSVIIFSCLPYIPFFPPPSGTRYIY